MVQYISVFGLVLIAAGWLSQYLAMQKGKKEVTALLPMLNMLGIALLISDSFMSNAMDIAAGNVLTWVCALLVLLALGKKK